MEEISSESSNKEKHPIFLVDPGTWMDYLHKEVCVAVAGGKTHTGRVYTIDPVSQSIALMHCSTDNNDVTVEVIMGHAVEKITVLDDKVDMYEPIMEVLFKPKVLVQLQPEEVKRKQDKLKSWLLKNRLPVTETGANGEQLNVCDALTIYPPYDPDNCQSTNEIILGKIQGLITNMPADVEDW